MGSPFRALAFASILCLALAACLPAESALSYRMDLDVDYDEGTFRGSLTVLYENPADADQGEVFFRLYGNADALYGSAALEVLAARVNGVDSPRALFADDTILMVTLPAPLSPAQSIEIALEFQGQAAQTTPAGFATPNEYGLLTKSEEVLTLTAFYPILAPYTEEGWAIDPVSPIGDPVFAEIARYDVSVVVEPDVAVIPTPDGSAIDPDGRTRWTFARDGLRDFPLVLSRGERAVQQAEASGIAVRAWFSPRHDAAATAALARGTAAVDLYSALFGPLPYPTIDIVEAPLQQAAGVECSGLFLVAAANAANPTDLFFDIIVAHEMAHQWFYAAVGNDPIESPWLDEALATFVSNVFLSVTQSEATARAERDAWSARYNQVRQAHPELSVTSPVYNFPDVNTYSAYVYSGGALDLELLRRQIGDDAFFAALADYYSSCRLRIAVADDLLASLRRACACWPASALFGSDSAPGP
jgi:aminopeptidase N